MSTTGEMLSPDSESDLSSHGASLRTKNPGGIPFISAQKCMQLGEKLLEMH
jgi:hypothetical protein